MRVFMALMFHLWKYLYIVVLRLLWKDLHDFSYALLDCHFYWTLQNILGTSLIMLWECMFSKLIFVSCCEFTPFTSEVDHFMFWINMPFQISLLWEIGTAILNSESHVWKLLLSTEPYRSDSLPIFSDLLCLYSDITFWQVL